jgi:hypothetical protein
MTSTPGQPDAAGSLTAALEGMDRLTVALDGMSERLREVSGRLSVAEESAHRLRLIVRALVVSFCLDLLITAGFGYNTVRVNGAQDATHTSEVSACQQANVNRSQDIAIWNRFLGDIAPPGTPRTAKVKAELAEINKLIKVKDTPRDCQSLYPK